MLHLVKGFFITIGLIIGVGPANAFVIKQGLKRQYLLSVVLLSSIAEYAYVVLGTKSLSAFITEDKALMQVMAYIGVVFLIAYGSLSMKAAFKKKPIGSLSVVPSHTSFRKVMMINAALVFLNPGLFAEAAIVIGGIGAQFQGNAQNLFLIGSALATFFWFFGIGYGASRMSGFFTNDKAWQVLEFSAAIIMFSAAFLLVRLVI
jgi:L-lysine exporter family protein LysE/ArgO